MRKFLITVNGNSYEVEVEELTGAAAAPQRSAAAGQAVPVCDPAASTAPAKEAAPQPQPAAQKAETPAGATPVNSPLPGIVLSVNVSVGDKVSEGDVLLIIEAMKMENEIMAPKAGTVLSITASRDMTVNTGDPLLVIG